MPTLSARTRTALLLAVLTLMMALPVMIGGLEIIRPLLNLTAENLAIFLLMVTVKWYCLGERLSVVLNANGIKLPTRKLIPIICAHDFSAETTPAGIGGPATAYALLKAKGVSLAQATTAGIFTTLFDAIAVSGILVIALVLVLFSTRMETHIPAFQATVACMVTLTLAGMFLVFNKRFSSLLLWLPVERLMPHTMHAQIHHLKIQLFNTTNAVKALPLSTFLRLLLLSLGCWSLRFSFLYLAIQTASGHLEWSHAALIQFVGTLTGMATFLPGGFPGADLSIGALLSAKLNMHILLSAILLWRLMTFYTNVAVGALAFLWLGFATLNQPPRSRI